MAQLEQALRWLPDRGPLRDYVVWASKTSHAPAHFHIVSILPVAAYLAAWNGYTWGDTWNTPEHFRVMTGIVCGSGMGKSTAVGGAQDFLETVLARVGKRVASPFIKASGSIPGLRLTMKEHHNEATGSTPCILVNDEVTALLRQDDFADTVNRWFDGRSDEHHTVWMRKEFKGEQDIGKVENPAPSGLFASTPISMQGAVRPEQIGGGLFSRILWAQGKLAPEELRLRRGEADEERVQLVQFWHHWCTYISALLPPAIDGCRHVVMTPDAFRMLESRLFDKYRADIANQNSMLSGIKMRLVEYAKQLGALFALSNPKAALWNRRLYITPLLLEPAIRFIEEQCEPTIEYLAEMLAPNPTRRLAAQIADALLERGPAGLARTELYRLFRVSKGELQAAVETLEDGGEVIMALTHAGPSGGRPSQRMVHAKHAPQMEAGGGQDNAAAASSRLMVLQGGLSTGGGDVR